MDPRTGEYVTLRDGALPPENFTVEVIGASGEVAALSDAVKMGRKYEVLYEATLHKLRVVRRIGKDLEKSGNPQLRAAGRGILRELD